MKVYSILNYQTPFNKSLEKFSKTKTDCMTRIKPKVLKT